ncbi:MAG: hypothetical protein ACK57T_18175 [Dolichospermum sp.]
MVSQNKCIFICWIWKIEDIQTVKTVSCSLFPVPCSLFPVPCSLFPPLTDNFFSKPYLVNKNIKCSLIKNT